MDNDTIEFEKVSIAEARAAFRGPEIQPKDDPRWVEQRKPQILSDMVLMKETNEWLGTIPERVKPHHLAKQFPRIANKIYNVWRRPDACIKVFDELMMDSRGTRQGFPLDIAKEITNLRAYYTSEVYKMKQDTWILNI